MKSWLTAFVQQLGSNLIQPALRAKTGQRALDARIDHFQQAMIEILEFSEAERAGYELTDC